MTDLNSSLTALDWLLNLSSSLLTASIKSEFPFVMDSLDHVNGDGYKPRSGCGSKPYQTVFIPHELSTNEYFIKFSRSEYEPRKGSYQCLSNHCADKECMHPAPNRQAICSEQSLRCVSQLQKILPKNNTSLPTSENTNIDNHTDNFQFTTNYCNSEFRINHIHPCSNNLSSSKTRRTNRKRLLDSVYTEYTIDNQFTNDNHNTTDNISYHLNKPISHEANNPILSNITTSLSTHCNNSDNVHTKHDIHNSSRNHNNNATSLSNQINTITRQDDHLITCNTQRAFTGFPVASNTSDLFHTGSLVANRCTSVVLTTSDDVILNRNHTTDNDEISVTCNIPSNTVTTSTHTTSFDSTIDKHLARDGRHYFHRLNDYENALNCTSAKISSQSDQQQTNSTYYASDNDKNVPSDNDKNNVRSLISQQTITRQYISGISPDFSMKTVDTSSSSSSAKMMTSTTCNTVVSDKSNSDFLYNYDNDLQKNQMHRKNCVREMLTFSNEDDGITDTNNNNSMGPLLSSTSSSSSMVDFYMIHSDHPVNLQHEYGVGTVVVRGEGGVDDGDDDDGDENEEQCEDHSLRSSFSAGELDLSASFRHLYHALFDGFELSSNSTMDLQTTSESSNSFLSNRLIEASLKNMTTTATTPAPTTSAAREIMTTSDSIGMTNKENIDYCNAVLLNKHNGHKQQCISSSSSSSSAASSSSSCVPASSSSSSTSSSFTSTCYSSPPSSSYRSIYSQNNDEYDHRQFGRSSDNNTMKVSDRLLNNSFNLTYVLQKSLQAATNFDWNSINLDEYPDENSCVKQGCRCVESCY
ncbi:unnamed protein product [Schistosoma turkestanicum]|nr:unnamed protein product [Schistosoma turkestanicum]